MIDIAALTPDQRLALIERLWDSLSSTPDAVRSPMHIARSSTAAWMNWIEKVQPEFTPRKF